MTAADGIRKLGFRRWYERQLIESHGFLVTGFLAMIAMLACLESLNLRGTGASVFATWVVIAGCGALCVWSLQRYHAILNRAEQVGEHSTCSRCTVYGALQVVHYGSLAADPESEGAPQFRVRCRKCGHEWNIG